MPNDEAWWEQHLLQNEKLMDKYMDVLGDEPDWEKWKDPDDLFNKVHYGIDPGEPLPPGIEPPQELAEFDDVDDLGSGDEEDEFPTEHEMIGADSNQLLDMEDIENMADTEDMIDRSLMEGIEELTDEQCNAFRILRGRAMGFAVHVMNFENVPEEYERVYMAAGKIGAHLAGGHGLGYSDDMICGNIVKCRWSLAECEFCIETFDFLAARTSATIYGELLAECQAIKPLIEEHIAGLRRRVWW